MPGTTLASADGKGEHGRMRCGKSVTSLSWILSEVVEGGSPLALAAGIAHDEHDDLEALRAGRFRFANAFLAWIDGDRSGAIADCGYQGSGPFGSTTARLGGCSTASRPLRCQTSSATPPDAAAVAAAVADIFLATVMPGRG
jgi:hypothetical protein